MTTISQFSPVVPSESDVLCGRGRQCFEHEGNKRFRYIVAANLQEYLTAKTRQDKTLVVYTVIYEVLENGGRFLKRDSHGQWYDSGMRGAKEKVGHALRDASTDKLKCVTKMSMEIFHSVGPLNNIINPSDTIPSDGSTNLVSSPQLQQCDAATTFKDQHKLETVSEICENEKIYQATVEESPYRFSGPCEDQFDNLLRGIHPVEGTSQLDEVNSCVASAASRRTTSKRAETGDVIDNFLFSLGDSVFPEDLSCGDEAAISTNQFVQTTEQQGDSSTSCGGVCIDGILTEQEWIAVQEALGEAEFGPLPVGPGKSTNFQNE